jgi:phosphopantetheinyl transferase
MASLNLPRTLLCPLTISRGETQYVATLAVVFDDQASQLIEFAIEFLGPTESAYFRTLRFARRQQTYLLGRYAAKLALPGLHDQPDLRAIEIGRGVFEQPIVHCAGRHGWRVTISHTESLGVALAFTDSHPMGVDVETVNRTRYETILTQLSERELDWVQAAARPPLEFATALWTAKEALSKVFCTGLMSPVQIYNLSAFNPVGPGSWEGFFQNFGQYKTTTWIGSSHALSIVLPKGSIIVNEYEIRQMLSDIAF